MTKWEYLTAPILTHAAKQILDNFGADGWELASVMDGGDKRVILMRRLKRSARQSRRVGFAPPADN